MLQSGRILQFVYLIVAFAAVVVLFELQKKRGFLPKMRRLAALDAIEEVVGRATEMGRPIHVSPGTPSLGESIEVETIAGLAVTGYVAKLCARYGVRCIATAFLPEMLPIVQEVVRQAYIAEAKPDAYKEEDVRYLTDQLDAYATAVQGIVERENCVGNIVVGRLYGVSFMIFARAAIGGKTMNIGGTAYYLNVPHLVATCDYVLIGEELFAAEAYLTQNPRQLMSLFSQDIFKFVSMGLVVLGTLLFLAGSGAMVTLLKM